MMDGINITDVLAIVTAGVLAYKTLQEALRVKRLAHREAELTRQQAELTREQAETEDTAQQRAKLDIINELYDMLGAKVERIDELERLLDQAVTECKTATQNMRERVQGEETQRREVTAAIAKLKTDYKALQAEHDALLKLYSDSEARREAEIAAIRNEYEAQIIELHAAYEAQIAELEEKYRQALKMVELQQAELFNAQKEIVQLRNGNTAATARALGGGL